MSLAADDLADLLDAYNQSDQVVECPCTEVSGPLTFDIGSLAQARLGRAAENGSSGSGATFSRYRIWAETIRGALIGVLEEEQTDLAETAKANLIRTINSLGAFCAIQENVSNG